MKVRMLRDREFECESDSGNEKSLYLADIQTIGQCKGEMTRIKVFAADLDQAYKGASAFGLVLAVYDADENLLV